jgi:hypothetical protein
MYLPSTGAAAVSPAFGAGWTQTTNATRLAMVTARISSANASIDGVGNTSTVTRQLIRQYVSAALAAQTLTGNIKGQIRCTTNAIGSAALAFRLAKCNSDGSSVTEIVALTEAADAETNAPPAFESGTAENRRLETPPSNTFSIDVGSTGISSGDRLIFEVGYKEGSANGGNISTLVIGDDSGTDLAEDETTTSADNPWFELSFDLAFSAGDAASFVKPEYRFMRSRSAQKRRRPA